ncbi:hypothetical protein GP486_005855 [Trichoglossum hirsutum]|uniref:Ubiquitin-like modifier HUB1 n=1 Tax=Trichoglossum hirsutum TaxID=265104 RepID=A0A9P8L8F2_9PEZI|nr:hypothetical protein GP486_005855 [Trichoglossum hirsutum]
MSDREDRRRSRSPRRRSPVEDSARYRRNRDDDSQRERRGGGGGFRWKDRRREDDRSMSGRGETWRNDRGYRDADRRRDDRDAYSKGVDHDARKRRRTSRSPARDKDRVAPGNEGQVDNPNRSDKPERPSKPKMVAAAQEPMIIVHVNDRLGTKAAIPCLASDPIRLFKAQVAARIGREPHEIMLKRQGERPFKDALTLEDYGVSNGVQLDLEVDTGD